MARFDVYRNDENMIVDVQADLLNQLNTRFVIPLFERKLFPIVAQRLNPILPINSTEYVLYTQFAATIRKKDMGEFVTNISEYDYDISNALDMLMSGY